MRQTNTKNSYQIKLKFTEIWKLETDTRENSPPKLWYNTFIHQ